eukprot:TRINITY_DN101815_c0_g1_i1.p1 TRINITY_DN101815_c0_g1~~TRINITY_DN101815_c0_g1_i1.p1  ORF type:complete len:609 (+),score=144.64 TRINITY_DN101815_c0_g1_i1:112-1938(+)
MAPTEEKRQEGEEAQHDVGARNAVIAKRLAKTLQTWLVKNNHSKVSKDNPEASVDRGWEAMWHFCDAGGSGLMGLEDFTNMVVRILHARGIQVADLEAFWDHALRIRDDHFPSPTSQSAKMTAQHFSSCLYKMYLEVWPDYTELQLSRCVSMLNEKADKVHKCSGNWYKVFNKFEAENPGWIDFNAFLSVVRRGPPGLSITQKELADCDIRGMWRAADASGAGRITVRDFMRFARYYGQIKKRGPAADEDPQYNKHELRSIAVRLARALDDWQQTRGDPLKIGKNALSDPNSRWCMLFTFTDDDGNGKIDLQEFVKAVQCLLKPKDITEAELKAWFRSLHLDSTGQVSPEEFALAVYRLEVDWWPVLPEQQVNRCVNVMNNAATHWHYKGTERSYHVTYGTWYKILNAQGADGHVNHSFAERTDCVRGGLSLDYNEFVKVIRSQWPGLHIHKRDLSDNEVKGVWKSLDVDRLGKVKFSEFMQFMRRHTAEDQQGICGGPILQKSVNEHAKKLQEKTLAATMPDSAATMRKGGYPGKASLTGYERAQATRDQETINAERRKGWVKHNCPSSSGILRQEDALRNVFLTEEGRSRVNRDHTPPLHYYRITA